MEKKLTLLQKAKAVQIRTKPLFSITEEDIEVAIAWANEEVGTLQVAEAYGIKKNGSQIYSKLALALKKAIMEQKLKINYDTRQLHG